MIKIKKVENRPVYDITVNKNHNFYANGILVHNCIEILEATGITKWQKENHPGKNINEIAVCNLASLALPMFLTITKGKDKKKKKAEFDHELLFKVAHQATINLNKVIDNNFYPVPETKFSNENHRPVGLGVQGLADVFAIIGIAFESEEAKKLNKEISETIYFAALTASNELAKKHGPYNSYEGSPISKGILQYDMWGMTEQDLSGRWDFTTLKKNIKKHGVRNSLLVALMPTASTSQILGNNECFEAFTANIYKRNTLSGEFTVVNKHLVNDLVDLGLWNNDLKNKLILGEGSVQNVPEIPTELKEIYKTVWEIKQKALIDLAADRGPFVCQTQSMNIFFASVNAAKLTSALFYAWEKGLKTGMYYLRTQKDSSANKALGVDLTKTEKNIVEEIACSIDNKDACESCSG